MLSTRVSAGMAGCGQILANQRLRLEIGRCKAWSGDQFPPFLYHPRKGPPPFAAQPHAAIAIFRLCRTDDARPRGPGAMQIWQKVPLLSSSHTQSMLLPCICKALLATTPRRQQWPKNATSRAWVTLPALEVWILLGVGTSTGAYG